MLFLILYLIIYRKSSVFSRFFHRHCPSSNPCAVLAYSAFKPSLARSPPSGYQVVVAAFHSFRFPAVVVAAVAGILPPFIMP
jgi:hypothetical protein